MESKSETTGSAVHNPHDKFVKEQFIQPEVCRPFFQAYIPPAIAADCEWATLQCEPSELIDDRLTSQHADLLFSVRCRSAPVFLYILFEHSSTPAPWLSLDILQKMVRIWAYCVKTQRLTDSGKLPPVIPFVLSQGESDWNASTRFHDLIDMPDKVREALAQYQPVFEHVLLDLHAVSMDQIKGQTIVRVILSLLKAVREDSAMEWVTRTEADLEELHRQGKGWDTMSTFFRYLLSAGNLQKSSTISELADRIKHQEIRTGIMTIAEELLSVGEARGVAIGEARGVAIGEARGVAIGEARGRIIGRIQFCQESLGLPVSDSRDFSEKDLPELSQMLSSLEVQFRARFHSDSAM